MRDLRLPLRHPAHRCGIQCPSGFEFSHFAVVFTKNESRTRLRRTAEHAATQNDVTHNASRTTMLFYTCYNELTIHWEWLFLSATMEKADIIIVTGPTGGHFFPGLAIGESLAKKHGLRILFAVTDKPYIGRWLRKKGMRYLTIPTARLSRRMLVLFPCAFLFSFISCLVVLIRELSLIHI